jgi:hypothetical protein
VFNGPVLRVNLESTDEFSPWNGPPSISGNDQSVILQGVVPGRYWVRLDGPPGFVSSMTFGDTDLLRKPLTVGNGSHIVIEATFRDDGGEVTGTVEGIGGGNKSNASSQSTRYQVLGPALQFPAYVFCLPVGEGGGQFRQSAVMPDGTFQLSQIPPGSYRVIAVNGEPMEIEYRNAEAMRAFESRGQLVRVSPGQTQKLDLSLNSTPE